MQKNSVHVEGFIHNELYQTETTTGVFVTQFILEHQYNETRNRSFFFNVKAYGKAAEYADDFIKGDRVFIRGNLRSEYDKQLGINRACIIIHTIEDAHDHDSNQGKGDGSRGATDRPSRVQDVQADAS